MITFFAAMILGAVPMESVTNIEDATLTTARAKIETSTISIPVMDVPALKLPSMEQSEQQMPKIEVPREAETSKNPQQDEQIQHIIRKGKRLEQECRWQSELELLESAFRKVPSSKALQEQYTRARVLCDIQKRHTLNSYHETIERMDLRQTLFFTQNFLNLFTTEYVHQVTYSDIFYREIRCMEIALENSLFCNRVLPEYSVKEVNLFRQEIQKFARNSVILTQSDLEDATMEIGRRFEAKFQKNASFLVLEGLFGFVLTLDCYSGILLSNQYQDIVSSISGNAVGIGVDLRLEKGVTQVAGVLYNTPAWRSGLLKNDIILSIDGMSIQNWSIEQVSEKMEGQEGEQLCLKVQTGQNQPRNVVITRETLSFSSIEHSMIIPEAKNIGYVRLASFQKSSPEDLHQALLQLQAQGMTKLVLDLRGNHGGAVHAAKEISNMFLHGGIIMQEKNSKQNLPHYADTATPWAHLELVVLIDEQSASAAEIFAGAIQDRNRGELIGKRSFGKGTIQSLLIIPGSDFVLKLTTSKFFSPTGKRYNYVGILPDHEVQEAGKPIFETLEEALLRQNLIPEPNHVSTLETESEKKEDSVLRIAMQVLTKH